MDRTALPPFPPTQRRTIKNPKATPCAYSFKWLKGICSKTPFMPREKTSNNRTRWCTLETNYHLQTCSHSIVLFNHQADPTITILISYCFYPT